MSTGTEFLDKLVKLSTEIKQFGAEYREVTGKAIFAKRSSCIKLDMAYRPDRFQPAAAGGHMPFW